MINIILSGGSGTRLWPISRSLYPKQFCKLINNKSLFQETVLRNKKICDKQFVVSNTEQYFMAIDHLEEIGVKNTKFLLEPIGRNTAPAIALACLSLNHEDLVLITPSDHMIVNTDVYYNVVEKAKRFAEENFLVTFGINPNYAETGYGYIEANNFDVIKFHEKPDLETAENYIKQGNFYWNSGMFVFKAGIFLDELKKYEPELYETCVIAYNRIKTEEPSRIKIEDMEKIPSKSIDVAVMERSSYVKVIPSDIGWSDLGSFDNLSSILPKDEHNNSFSSIEDLERHINIGAKNNLIFSDHRTIAAIDIEDLIIVDTADALLVSKKGSSQQVKDIVNELVISNSDLHTTHLTVHRPWGTYTVLEESERFKIKRIVVKPGKRLSLQKHHHRSEHWIVVSGTAKVTLDQDEKVVRMNESFYIPIGELHRLENPGKIPLVIIEVQVGEYLGEDDIVRVQDDFKRIELTPISSLN
ncbi:MAG: mannose-1-phosphate guanylyltransferase/mannose-6-phosphate isomerase [Candidatus Sericytochromatia bacterium]